jgi:hypothetical protein
MKIGKKYSFIIIGGENMLKKLIIGYDTQEDEPPALVVMEESDTDPTGLKALQLFSGETAELIYKLLTEGDWSNG